MNRPLAAAVAAVALGLGAPRTQDSLAQLVPADAKFACYFDLQALIDFVGRDELQAAVAHKVSESGGPKLRRDWNTRLAQDWGIDPMHDLLGLLVFGDDLQGRTPNAVLITTDRVDVLLEKLQDMSVLEHEERGGVAYERVAPDRFLGAFGIQDVGAEGELYLGVVRPGGSLRDRRAIVLGTDLGKLLPAVEALQGPRAAARTGALTLSPRSGCIAYLEVADALRELMDRTPASRVANKATHLSMQLSEEQGEVLFTAAVQTETAKDARQIAALVNGLKALVTLVEPDEDLPQPALEALDSAQAEARGNQVSLRVAVPRELIDQARRMLRDEMGSDQADEGEEEPRRPRAGEKSRRTIR